MTNCPLCKNPIDTILLMDSWYWQRDTLAVAHKINPGWREEDACCQGCFDTITEAVAELKEARILRPAGGGVSSAFRYVLTVRESVFWNHQNREIQNWWRHDFLLKVSEEASSQGYHEWFVFDTDESLLAFG